MGCWDSSSSWLGLFQAYDQNVGQQILNPDGTVGQMGDGGDDGTVLYIDPNDPQAAEILQQAGLRLTEDGQVVPHNSDIDSKLDLVGMSTASSNAQDLIGNLQSPVTTAVASQPASIMLPQQPVPATKLVRRRQNDFFEYYFSRINFLHSPRQRRPACLKRPHDCRACSQQRSPRSPPPPPLLLTTNK